MECVAQPLVARYNSTYTSNTGVEDYRCYNGVAVWDTRCVGEPGTPQLQGTWCRSQSRRCGAVRVRGGAVHNKLSCGVNAQVK